ALIELPGRARRSGTVASPEQREENLRRLVRAAMPQEEVSETLRRRVRALEAAPAASRRSRLGGLAPWRRLGWALAIGVAIAGVLAPIIQPRWVAARTLSRMQAAISDARSAHNIFWRIAR